MTKLIEQINQVKNKHLRTSIVTGIMLIICILVLFLIIGLYTLLAYLVIKFGILLSAIVFIVLVIGPIIYFTLLKDLED